MGLSTWSFQLDNHWLDWSLWLWELLHLFLGRGPISSSKQNFLKEPKILSSLTPPSLSTEDDYESAVWKARGVP